MAMDNRVNGLVIKGLGGLYEVRCDASEKHVFCRGRGVLKRGESKLYIGDKVTLALDATAEEQGVIETILPRKNALIRPPLANIDIIFAVLSAVSPAPSLATLDKMIAICEHNNITPVIVLSKEDLSPKETEAIAAIYRKVGLDVFVLSSMQKESTTKLSAFIDEAMQAGKVAAFAGASGVGKSTLLNTLFPNFALSTGTLSEKTARGKHTTRHVELFPVGNGYLADTPGFSLLDFERFDFMPLDELIYAFRDLTPYLGQCRYVNCTHIKETECGITEALRRGDIVESRHQSYAELYQILKEKERKY